MKYFITSITQRMEYIVEKIPWIYRFFETYYENIIENEIRLADIKEDDRVLCIGGGPCPCTAIELHRMTGAHVSVIDNDKEVINSAIKNIERLNLSDFISVELADGSSICPKDFSVVHIALQVSPKNTVFNEIVNGSCPGTKVMVRISNENFSKLYSPVKTDSIVTYKKIHHKKKNLDYTLLHVTTGGANEETLDTYNSPNISLITT